MELEPWEYLAFRLLGNPARFKMLRALKQTPMTSREMAKDLELHLGAVSRDVSNMQDAGASQHRVFTTGADGTSSMSSLCKF